MRRVKPSAKSAKRYMVRVNVNTLTDVCVKADSKKSAIAIVERATRRIVIEFDTKGWYAIGTDSSIVGAKLIAEKV